MESCELYYLYGSKMAAGKKLVATFDSEPQALAYVSWAKLRTNPDGTAKFEQGSVLSGCDRWEHSPTALNEEVSDDVLHNPSPNML